MKEKNKITDYNIQMKDKIYGLVVETHKTKEMCIIPTKPETWKHFLINIRDGKK